MRMAAGLLGLWLVFAPSDTDTDTGGSDTGDTGDTDTGDTDTGDTGVLIDPGPAVAPAPAAAPAVPQAPANDPDAPITVTTRLTPETLHIGDLMDLEVIVAYPADHDVNLPHGIDLSPLEIVGDVEVGEVESTGEGLRQRFIIHLQYFDVGEAAVPSFPVTWIDPGEQVHTYHVQPHAFVVESLLANESDPQVQAEDPPISLEYPNVRLAMIIVSVAAGLVLAALAGLILLRVLRREKPAPVVPKIPAHVVALQRLGALAAQREAMLEAGAFQEFYLRLTEIAKAYLGERFDFEALDRTTEEIQDLLRSGAVRLDPLRTDEVLTFLQDCDLVKFARLSPRDEETLEALDVVRGMIERSRVRPIAEAQPASPVSIERDVPQAARPTPSEDVARDDELPKPPGQESSQESAP
ncbi:MAG: hypothetical protein KC431_01930 [Myxococcales bacterium]|nr:hypothetical protein [Myxococcales bacterium]